MVYIKLCLKYAYIGQLTNGETYSVLSDILPSAIGLSGDAGLSEIVRDIVQPTICKED